MYATGGDMSQLTDDELEFVVSVCDRIDSLIRLMLDGFQSIERVVGRRLPHSGVIMSQPQQSLAASIQMSRSVSVPAAADAGIEQSPSEQHSFFSPTSELPPVHPVMPSAVGHSHHLSASAIYAGEPQTPNESNTHNVATVLLSGLGGGPVERRNSKPNLRLQSQAPSKLSSAALSVPTSSLLAPASPLTPAFNGGQPPPNTPQIMSQFDLMMGSEPITPLFDQPFTPMAVPPSPMLPQAPPSSPFPALSLSTSSSSSPSPLMSPAASPHPIRHIMNLPATMSGVDILVTRYASDSSDSSIAPPLPPEPEEEADEDEEDDTVYVNNTAEFEVPSQESEPQKVLLHRSRLGRLSIIHREDLKGRGLLSPQSSSSSSAATVASPTAIAHLSPEELAKHSLTHGPTVTAVQRVQHIAFDPNEAGSSLQNIPPEWREALKSSFGIPATLCASVKLAAYPSRIPLILVRMHEYLKSHRGYDQVGIFRLAPDANDCAKLKGLINENINNLDIVTNINDMNNSVANLIKVWFRDLPVALFQGIPPESLSSFSSATSNQELESVITQYLREPSQSILRWLLDLGCDVTKHSETNKMVAKNIAICISPNLYKPPAIKSSTNAAESLKMMNQCKYYTNFLELCIGMREEQRGQKKTSIV